jgi:hypothetical protein
MIMLPMNRTDTRNLAIAGAPRNFWLRGFGCAPQVEAERVGLQNSATGPDLDFYAAHSYSLMRPPRTAGA